MYKSALDFLSYSQNPVELTLQKEYELFSKSSLDVYNSLEEILNVMTHSAVAAIEEPDRYVGKLIGGDAHKLYHSGAGIGGHVNRKAMAYALSSSEVNASMGKICAAPTAGSCGILPAAVMTAKEELKSTNNELMDGLLVASMIGELITINATVSGAEGGCQAECGSAAAMAAGMLVYLQGGSNEAIFDAAAIAIKNIMGLICDPIAGLVESPCAKRNASGIVNAIASSDMVLSGVKSIVPFDEVVKSMAKVGKALPDAFKETAKGGIAITPTGIQLKKEIFKGEE